MEALLHFSLHFTMKLLPNSVMIMGGRGGLPYPPPPPQRRGDAKLRQSFYRCLQTTTTVLYKASYSLMQIYMDIHVVLYTSLYNALYKTNVFLQTPILDVSFALIPIIYLKKWTTVPNCASRSIRASILILLVLFVLLFLIFSIMYTCYYS